MKNLTWEYFKQHFDSNFIAQNIATILNDENIKPQIDQFDNDSLDYIYEDLGIDIQFIKVGGNFDLANIFFHLNNSGDGYASFKNPPFGITKDFKKSDVHAMFGTPDTEDEGIPDIDLNPYDIFNKKSYNLTFEYTAELKIKTFAIETKFNR